MRADRSSIRVVPDGVGTVFRLLMQVRMLLAALALLLVPQERLSVTAFILVLAVAILSLLAANYWQVIVPQVLTHPVLAAVDILLSFVVLGFGGPSGPYLLATVATSATAGLLFHWRGMLGVSFLQLGCYYTMLALAPDDPSMVTFQTALGQPLCYPLFGFAGVALRNLLEQQDVQEQARRKAEALAAAGEERTRLAREMHDSLAKTLRGIALAAAALPLWVGRDPGRAVVEAERIASATEIASREARDLLSELREDNVTKPLAQAVRDTAERWGEQNGLIVRCWVDAEAELPLLARYEAVSVLSEALANVARHAAAHSVEVVIAREAEGVVLTVHDDGCGFELPEFRELARGGHYGLIGLRERAQRVGGTVELSSQVGAGTTVTARFLAGTTEPSLAEVN